MSRRTDTKARMVVLAGTLIQQRGFNGFSYQDIADELGIRKASLHYHFPSKAELGTAVIEAHRQTVFSVLGEPLGGGAVEQSLDRFIDDFRAIAHMGDRMSLTGVLAAEFSTLPNGMRVALRGFFRDAEAWLGTLLAKGRKDGTFHFDGKPSSVAQAAVAALEGALLIGRARDADTRIEAVARMLDVQVGRVPAAAADPTGPNMVDRAP